MDSQQLVFPSYASAAPRTPSPREDPFFSSYPSHQPYEAPGGGSLLQELYDDHHPAVVRRATFPYVRADYPAEPITLPPMHHHHHPHHHQQFYQPFPSPPPPSYTLSPHTGLPVQHTDDAASKETQYLRRRCFNCHTTEPPSWRRSTLNPGKIVCNKCGLYERTHLRPRPLRFDELRAGNKARKAAAAQAPQKKPLSPKKEHSRSPQLLPRRASQEWDDSRSVYLLVLINLFYLSLALTNNLPTPPPLTLSAPHPPPQRRLCPLCRLYFAPRGRIRLTCYNIFRYLSFVFIIGCCVKTILSIRPSAPVYY
ncbi:uncharacterized protein BT62DRAFT_785148 [Guyanagaster necrorhizus]|uniref:GATA-type domain-containing protein n=1 Tax=Guyanagaster necrorhizus TaxID=856835 RepID=A0A9P7VUD7_9AGAR|nr:uncharacterized protein BT62DRAFT_785148 [Guyanagaster necrorhizus MCA 3950]KAG7447631.1 hypothetical protein BT62DRAFT_785148 [Guyanagaster necrorhizus MCA 3950]